MYNLADFSVSSIGSRPEPYGTSILQMCRLYCQFKFKFNVNQNENENKNATGEDTYARALRAPRAGSPDCVFVFVFVFVKVKFELRKDLTLPVIYPTFGFSRKRRLRQR